MITMTELLFYVIEVVTTPSAFLEFSFSGANESMTGFRPISCSVIITCYRLCSVTLH